MYKQPHYLHAALVLSLVAALLSAPASAQLMKTGYPSAEIIANADNFQPPKLTEYAAKLASQPDFTGLWNAMLPKESGVGPTFDPVNTFWPPQPVEGEALFGPMPGTYLTNIPYKPEYQEKYKHYIKESEEGKSRDTFAACVPYGMPRMIYDSPVPFDIIQSPEVIFFYNNYGRSERRIFLDGRKHPTQATSTGELGASYSGHSVGQWEGNTLVVDTVDIIPGNYDETAAFFSSKLHLTERIRLVAQHILEIKMTLEDPEYFEKPWVVTRYFFRSSNFGQLKEGAMQRPFINLNDRPCVPNVGFDEDGYQVILLPQEAEAQHAAKEKEKAKKKAKKK